MNTIHDVRLLRPDDPEYIAWMRRMAEGRPSRGGPRQAGEYLGGLVEQCVRRWLNGFVPLQDERILTWEQRLRNGRSGRMCRELDAVWTIDSESLCLFEMKLTFPENMQRGVGLRQLRIATETLFKSERYRYILQRLVYVGAEPIPVLEDEEGQAQVPVVMPDDEYEELGVIWAPPAEVEAAARELGLELPANWLEPESREGTMEDPERESWREFADTETFSGTTKAAEPKIAESPLARALRLAMRQESEN